MTTPHWVQRVCHRLGCAAKDTNRLKDAGFTILEALVSFVIFAVVATSASAAIVNALRASHGTQQRVDAAHVAQIFISDAILRATTIPPVEGKTIFAHVGSDGKTTQSHYAEYEQFTVIETIRLDAGSCNSGRLFTVNVEVHQSETDKYLARSDARVACPRV